MVLLIYAQKHDKEKSVKPRIDKKGTKITGHHFPRAADPGFFILLSSGSTTTAGGKSLGQAGIKMEIKGFGQASVFYVSCKTKMKKYIYVYKRREI